MNAMDLSKDYVISRSLPVFPRCGVYFLIKDDEIIYVGKSVRIPNRLRDHQRGKDFDRVFFVECKEDELDDLEKRCIREFSPRLNRRLKKVVIKRVREKKAPAPKKKKDIRVTRTWTPTQEELDAAAEWRRVRDELSEAKKQRTAEIIRLYAEEKWTYQQIADEWSITKEAVRQTLQKNNADYRHVRIPA